MAAITADTAIEVAEDDGTTRPENSGTLPQERHVPAAAIRAALIHPDLKPDPHGLRLAGAVVTEELDLKGATLPELALIDTHLTHLNLDKIKVDGDVIAVGLVAAGEVRALGARIGGQLKLGGVRLIKPDGEALHLELAAVDRLNLRGFKVDGVLNLICAEVADLVVDDSRACIRCRRLHGGAGSTPVQPSTRA